MCKAHSYKTIGGDPVSLQDNLMETNMLLNWYDRHGRTLPWRTLYPQMPNVYHVVVSEFMLQQTTVNTVIPYFTAFIQRYPSFQALSQAPLEDVLHGWQGLGYYRRARYLWDCAHYLKEHIPKTIKEWQALPGFGPYMVAAVLSIAFNQPHIALDGNLKRVFSRLFTVHEEAKLTFYSQTFLHPHRTGDVNQALMDLGATLCRPKNPQCTLCPLQTLCKAYAQKNVEAYPPKKIKKAKPVRYVYAYICTKKDRIALEKREGTGL
jgi:A/G-specific adenine glycosylase